MHSGFRKCFGGIGLALAFLIVFRPVFAADTGEAPSRDAFKKPVQVRQQSPNSEEIDSTGEIEKAEEDETAAIFLKPYVQKITFNGSVELNFDYVDVSDVADNDSGSSTEVFISSVELVPRVFFNRWAKAKMVLTAEDIGNKNENKNIVLDEAFITLKCPWAPLYFKGGKTVLPFGVFEERLIGGTLTEELYQITDIGAALGAVFGQGAWDLSATLYKGENIIDNLEDFGAHDYRTGRSRSNAVDSYTCISGG